MINELSNPKIKNKYQVVILLFAFLLSSTGVNSQSLVKNFGGVKTNFKINLNSEDISVIDQVIVQRGTREYNSYSFSEGAYGYGYGLQSLYLEFITDTKIEMKDVPDRKVWRTRYEIKLVDEQNSTLLILKVKFNKLRILSNGDDLFTYSLNLREFPLVLLDRTRKLSIKRVDILKTK